MPRLANPDRAAARLAGRSHYRGAACRHGHDGLRYASTGACVACVAGYRATSSRICSVYESLFD